LRQKDADWRDQSNQQFRQHQAVPASG
jgi:hypothetical protein